MMYIRWFMLAVISLALNITTILASPILGIVAAMFRRLPGFLRYLSTTDDDVFGSKTTGEPVPAKFVGRWKRATWWIARNPNYTFDAKVLGFPHEGMRFIEGASILSMDFHPKNGRKAAFALMEVNGKRYFSYRLVIPYGSKYIKMWIGWSYVDNGTGNHMIKFMFHPMLSFK